MTRQHRWLTIRHDACGRGAEGRGREAHDSLPAARETRLRARAAARRPRRRRLARVAWLSLLLGSGFLACSGGPRVPGLAARDEAVTLSDVQDAGDDRRRASNHLVLQGLDADDLGEFDRALDRYELSLTVDPGNPWSYLAIARHELDRGDPKRSLAALDRSRALFELEGPIPFGVETQLIGLHGAALEQLGRFDEGREEVAEARRRAPAAWGDGYLSAGELR